jgi:hypothetical protein
LVLDLDVDDLARYSCQLDCIRALYRDGTCQDTHTHTHKFNKGSTKLNGGEWTGRGNRKKKNIQLPRREFSKTRVVRIIHKVVNGIYTATRAGVLPNRASPGLNTLRGSIVDTIASAKARLPFKNVKQTKPMAHLVHEGLALVVLGIYTTRHSGGADNASVQHVVSRVRDVVCGKGTVSKGVAVPWENVDIEIGIIAFAEPWLPDAFVIESLNCPDRIDRVVGAFENKAETCFFVVLAEDGNLFLYRFLLYFFKLTSRMVKRVSVVVVGWPDATETRDATYSNISILSLVRGCNDVDICIDSDVHGRDGRVRETRSGLELTKTLARLSLPASTHTFKSCAEDGRHEGNESHEWKHLVGWNLLDLSER